MKFLLSTFTSHKRQQGFNQPHFLRRFFISRKLSKSPFLSCNDKFKKSGAGFTLVEILVATTLFAFTVAALTSLFSYVLRINRKAEALRQATQAERDLVETIAKEVRNGQIDYGVASGSSVETYNGPSGACPLPPAWGALGAGLNPGDSLVGKDNIRSSYSADDTRLGTVDKQGNRYCFYLASDTAGTPVVGSHAGYLTEVQNNGTPQPINPPNETINYLAFYVRPLCDPYVTACKDYGNTAPKIQPFVTIIMEVTTHLPTGENVVIPYQTSVSTDNYDVPNSP